LIDHAFRSSPSYTPILIAENPMDCVAIGTGVMLDNIDKIARRRLM